MKYIEFRKNLQKMLVFNLSEIYKIDPHFDLRRLYEWQRKRYITKIHNGYYIFSDIELNENLLYKIANIIYKHSYVSLETALNYYDLIPEQPYMILSVSTRKTRTFKTQIGNFYYRKIANKYFFGYRIEKIENTYWKMASPEKALVDYFYLTSYIVTKEDIISARINSEVFENIINVKVLKIYAKLTDNQRVKKCIDYLIEEMTNVKH